MSLALVIGLVNAAAVILLFIGVYASMGRPDDVMARVETYAGTGRGPGSRGEERRRGPLRSLRRFLDRLLSGQALARRLALRLAQANARMTVPEFLGIVVLATVAGSLLGFVLRGYTLSSLAGALIGCAVPWLWLEFRRQRRLNHFRDQLIDVLVLIVGSLRSGHGLVNALELVSKQLDPPASEEFSRVMREIGFGLSQTEALANLVRRMESDDLQLVVTAVSINQEVGGNLSLVLDKIAETIRERIRLEGEVRVLTTQQRLTSYLLVGLPFILGTVLALINPAWMMRLFKPGWVRLIPLSAFVAEVVGFIITRRLVRIEV